MELLAHEGELFGLQMVEQSDGRLKRGTVYVTLGRMQEKGYLESRQEALPEGAIGLPRRLYRPTGHAMRVLADVASRRAVVLQRATTSRHRDGQHRAATRVRVPVVRSDHRRNVFEPMLADWHREWRDAPRHAAEGSSCGDTRRLP